MLDRKHKQVKTIVKQGDMDMKQLIEKVMSDYEVGPIKVEVEYKGEKVSVILEDREDLVDYLVEMVKYIIDKRSRLDDDGGESEQVHRDIIEFLEKHSFRKVKVYDIYTGKTFTYEIVRIE